MSEADPTSDPDTDTADHEDDSTTGVDVDVDVDSADFPPGALVVDREDDDPEPDHAVVLNTPPIRAADWTVHRLETTVAKDNPDYPADDPVVVVAFREYLEEHDHLPDWDDHDGYWSMAELNEQGVRFYAFPASRLEPLEEADPDSELEPESELGSAPELNPDESAEPAPGADPDVDREHERGDSDREDDLESVIDLKGLTDRLEDAGCAVHHQGDRLQVSKLGEIYQITAAGEITGDGALRERLESVVSEYERG
jgi:hypothetical protein